MSIKQLFLDIINGNTKSMYQRWYKFVALLKRLILLPFYQNFGNGKNLKAIPIIINNRNRYTHLMLLIEWLEKQGMTNIFIVDNESTYPPLLDFYAKTNYRVFRLNQNIGHLAFWKTGIIKQFENDYYIYTDPDVVPVKECPSDLIEFMMNQLKRYKQIEKIGIGLKIDDLPDHYSEKQKVIDWEQNIVGKELIDNVFDARVDTTFALYRPYINGERWVPKAYRTGGNYMARHLPWYENSSEPLEEDHYYRAHVRTGASHWIS